MISMGPKNKMLDLRYNELFNDWNGTDEFQGVIGDVRGQLVLSWRNLNVSAKQITQKFFKQPEITYKKILDNVSGNVQCGTLLGIMGPSGSGKTTLMTTISHRTRGNFEGELLLNGQPIVEKVMIKMSAFVPQHDIRFDHLTTLEHLYLMTKLKMDRGTTDVEVKKHVDYLISTVGMGEFLNTRMSFLSGGECKKVALAVQLINDPPILFCDEITTGLDSYSAAHIVNTLKGFARTGKIVVCTIHQPASGVLNKFDEIILMSNGRLAYQGPVSMARQLFERFDYKCPHMFNEAEFMISILSSNSEKVKKDVDKMCELSSTNQQTDVNYNYFNNQKKLDYNIHLLQTKNLLWVTQFKLVLNRSLKCFVRSYQTKLLDLTTILFLSILISFPYGNLKFDSQAVQNWEGFWFVSVMFCIHKFTYLCLSTYLIQFTIIHREIHNEVYPLSAYYVSDLLIKIAWTMILVSIYCTVAFTVVGITWGSTELFIYIILAYSAFSFGALLSAIFNNTHTIYLFVNVYDHIALFAGGSYLSLKTLPKVVYYLRYFSLFFLGNEITSTVFWEKIPNLPCNDVNNCLNGGKAVLNNYGYISGDFYMDLTILISFCIFANILGYFGILKKMKKQPAY